MRTITLPAGKAQKNLARLSKWVGVVYDFSGNFMSDKWAGYKMQMRDGCIIIHIWERHLK
jgi:hypothetical protein